MYILPNFLDVLLCTMPHNIHVSSLVPAALVAGYGSVLFALIYSMYIHSIPSEGVVNYECNEGDITPLIHVYLSMMHQNTMDNKDIASLLNAVEGSC